MTLNRDQVITIKCAYADLTGALQAMQQGDMHAHDWEAHLLTLQEMSEHFDFLPALPSDITK